jgi:hypothetical protein
MSAPLPQSPFSPKDARKDPWTIPPLVPSLAVKIALFVLISYGLVSLVGEGIVGCFIGLLWNVVFGYFLWRGKTWARWALLGKAILAIFASALVGFIQKDYLGASFELLFNIVIIVLLWGTGSTKRALVCFGGYLFLLILFGNILYGDYHARQAELQFLISAPMIKEYRSDKNYKISLDDIDWKILSPTDTQRLLGEQALQIDCSLVKKDASAFGLLIPESMQGNAYNQQLSEIIEKNMKLSFEHKLTDWKRYDEKEGFLLTATTTDMSPEYSYVLMFKNLSSVGIYVVLWAPRESDEHLLSEAQTIFANLSSISIKERLPKFSTAEIYSENKDAVVLISIFDLNGQLVSFGTGFNIAEEGLIVTNMHVVLNKGYFAEVKFPKHGTYKDVKIIGLGTNGLDLALLSIGGHDLPKVQGMRSVEVVPGDKIVVIGNPEGYLNSLSEGIIGAIRQDEWGSTSYQMTAAVSGGSSGGPVFNEYGEVIGIATATVATAQNLNFSIAIDELQKVQLLEKPITLKSLKEYLDTRRPSIIDDKK